MEKSLSKSLSPIDSDHVCTSSLSLGAMVCVTLAEGVNRTVTVLSSKGEDVSRAFFFKSACFFFFLQYFPARPFDVHSHSSLTSAHYEGLTEHNLYKLLCVCFMSQTPMMNAARCIHRYFVF